MKPRLLSTPSTALRRGLSVLLLLLSSCAPAAVPTEQPAAPVAVESSPTAFFPVEPTLVPTTEVVAAPTEAAAPLPAATSRGPDLEATSPHTVSLASGGLQFVEFFRFT